MIKKFVFLMLLVSILFLSCVAHYKSHDKYGATPSNKNTSLKSLDRKTIAYNKSELLELLSLENFSGQNISLKLCVNSNGDVSYVEVLDDSTYEIPEKKGKALLKSIHENVKFETSSHKEDCGLFVIE